MVAKKLSKQQVIEVWNSTEVQRKIAHKFGVSISVISEIKRGDSYKNITRSLGKSAVSTSPNARRPLDDKSVIDIFTSNERTKDLANKYGVHWTTIRDIKNGKNWGRVTDPLVREKYSELKLLGKNR